MQHKITIRNIISEDCEIISKEALLYIHDECNYSCSYCMLGSSFFEKREESKATTPEGTKAIIDFFNEEGDWHIFLSGGEPSLHPEFIELCKELSKRNYIRIDTNNSMDGEKLNEFIKEINPEKVDFINCSLHECDEETERLNNFIERVKLLRINGFKAYVSYVAVPEKINKISELFERFMSYDIPFVVIPFRSPEYPQAYTKEEIVILDKYMISATNRALVDTVDRKPKGKLCSAGYKRINVNGINGNIYKCWRSSSIIGNIYDKSIKLLDKPTACMYESCTYMYEPHLEVQELLYKDLENILDCSSYYNKNIYKDYKERSV